MRPLALRMSGLRSYRHEQLIDFTDAGLMAIVGDTGAGKSSILEALFFALYGGCTWDHRAAVPLISDGAEVMQVELSFRADERNWKVFRSASRTGTGVRHELVCLDDPSVRFDNSDPVTAEIQKLVGLDRDAFLRTVVLPQGRFQMLLQATRTERTALLKGIFRLDELAAVHDQADLVARRLRPGVQELKVERARLLPDPAAALVEATERRDRAGLRQRHLRGISERITTETRRGDGARRHGEELAACASAANDALAPGSVDELAGVVSKAGHIAQQRAQAESGRASRQVEVDSLDRELKTADEAGEGLEDLAAALSTIASLREQLPLLGADIEAARKEADDVEDLRNAVSAEEDRVGDLQRKAQAASAESERVERAVRAASQEVDEARALLHAAREKSDAFSNRQDEARVASERVELAEADVAAASEVAQVATERLSTARRALEDIQRAHAAAHAAHGCKPGDPCPVCVRALPAGFSPPLAPGDEEARSELALAEEGSRSASNALAAREQDLANAKRDIEIARERVEGSSEELAKALNQLRVRLPVASLDSDDETVLAPLVVAASEVGAQHGDLVTQAGQLGQEAAAAAAVLQSQRTELQRREQQLGLQQESVRNRQAGLEASAGGLPASFAVEPPLTDHVLAGAAKRISARREQLAEVDRKRDEARRSVQELGGQLEALNQRERAEVDQPAQQVRLRLVSLSQRLQDLSARLGNADVPPSPEGSLSEEAAWAVQLHEVADAMLLNAQEAVADFQRELDQAVVAVEQALAEAGVADELGLNDALIEASAALAKAQDDIEVATRDLPRAAELDQTIRQSDNLLASLDELTRLLSDSRFIAYVVARKQRSLLAVASEVLGSMTGGRYGFSEGFDIVDRQTGLPRSVKTLSGGETFLASLALALALVELAGRGGGRLDALFLDEGFGSLDANALAEALEALGHQAETGRLVAVISHLRSVAENMDRVLAVTLGPDGSRAHWLGGDERGQLVAEDIESGLLS